MSIGTLESKTESVMGNGYTKDGLNFERVYTKEGLNPLDQIEYEKRTSIIEDRKHPGKNVFYMENVEVPKKWSQLATDIIAEKYFRKKGVQEIGYETSAKQVVDRIAGHIRTFGEQRGYFSSQNDANVFQDELSHILINQIAAFNSPVWFNVGLSHKYGIKTDSAGNWVYDWDNNKIVPATDGYSRPQASACFIQSVEDDLMSMQNLQKSETRLFKYGSGTGTNFSKIRGRGESLSSGGTSSGLISFLNGFNAWAGATKSGGTTRRAAKMVILDQDHPEIRDFIEWKTKGERIVKILKENGYDVDFEGEAYSFAPGQNSNNSVRLYKTFWEALKNNGKIQIKNRTDGKVVEEIPASELMDLIALNAYESADPGLQFDDIINNWHTCPNTDRIKASNPCSEYMFLDDSACNLASINLVKFLNEDGTFDIPKYKHVIKTLTSAQEILVTMASYPTEKIGRNSEDYRPLGLGFANLGTLLMMSGLPYDSEEGRAFAGSLSAIMTGEAYAQSARIAGTKIGPFNGYAKNKEPFMKVMNMHRDSAYEIKSFTNLEDLVKSARETWDEAVQLGVENGYRNAQASVIAPTGTIGLLMDCDTTGIEPEFALAKLKKLAGGGKRVITNHSVSKALSRLGYNSGQIQSIMNYIQGRKLENIHELDVLKPEHVNILKKSENLDDDLKKLGYTQREINSITWFVNGKNTIEGAPYVKSEHYPIFDTANKPSWGKRVIDSMGHVKMMAAVQPFISGAISKTVNLPEEASVEDIKEVYVKSHELGIKALAVYRDGSKHSQPLNVVGGLEDKVTLNWGERKALPSTREGITQKIKVGGTALIFRTGEYEDGKMGELFIDAYKGGSEWKTALNVLSVVASKGLQWGLPLEELVSSLMEVKADPSGITQEYPHLKMSRSVYDAIGKIIAIEYLGETDLATEPQKVDKSKLRAERNRLIANLLKHKDELHTESADQENNFGGNGRLQIDASGPPCKECGGITRKNGTCFLCENCGTTNGCS